MARAQSVERRKTDSERKRDRLIDHYEALPTPELMEREDVIRSILEARWMLCEVTKVMNRNREAGRAALPVYRKQIGPSPWAGTSS